MTITQKAVTDSGMQKIMYAKLKNNPAFNRNKILMPIAGAFFIALGLLIIFKVFDIYLGLGIASLIFGVMFFAALAGSFLFLRNKVSKMARSFAAANPQVIIDEKAVSVKTSQTTTRIKWEELTTEEYPEYIALCKTDGTMVILKKSELKSKEIKWILHMNDEE